MSCWILRAGSRPSRQIRRRGCSRTRTTLSPGRTATTVRSTSQGNRWPPSLWARVEDHCCFPTLLEGHPPVHHDKIVSGTKTLRRTGRHVGDLVPVTINGRQQNMRVVGRAVFPAFGQGGFTPTDLGKGAAMQVADLGRPPAAAVAGTTSSWFDSPPPPRRPPTCVSLERRSPLYSGWAGARVRLVVLQLATAYGHRGLRPHRSEPVVLAAVLGVLGVAGPGAAARVVDSAPPSATSPSSGRSGCPALRRRWWSRGRR